MSTTALHSVIARLVDDDVDGLVAVFDQDPDLDFPESGRQLGAVGAAETVAKYRALFAEGAAIRPVNEITTASRSVIEVSVALADHSNPLTVAVVGEFSDDGLQRVRGYHAMKHYKGHYTARPQLIDIPADRPTVPHVVARYFDAVHHSPDIDQAVSLYTDDAFLVAPQGKRAEGRDALRFVYSLFLESGGIALHHCAAIDNGESVAIEWACDRWGSSVFPDLEAGCAVYDYANNKLHAARIYDDLNPPF